MNLPQYINFDSVGVVLGIISLLVLGIKLEVYNRKKQNEPVNPPSRDGLLTARFFFLFTTVVSFIYFPLISSKCAEWDKIGYGVEGTYWRLASLLSFLVPGISGLLSIDWSFLVTEDLKTGDKVLVYPRSASETSSRYRGHIFTVKDFSDITPKGVIVKERGTLGLQLCFPHRDLIKIVRDHTADVPKHDATTEALKDTTVKIDIPEQLRLVPSFGPPPVRQHRKTEKTEPVCCGSCPTSCNPSKEANPTTEAVKEIIETAGKIEDLLDKAEDLSKAEEVHFKPGDFVKNQYGVVLVVLHRIPPTTSFPARLSGTVVKGKFANSLGYFDENESLTKLTQEEIDALIPYKKDSWVKFHNIHFGQVIEYIWPQPNAQYGAVKVSYGCREEIWPGQDVVPATQEELIANRKIIIPPKVGDFVKLTSGSYKNPICGKVLGILDKAITVHPLGAPYSTNWANNEFLPATDEEVRTAIKEKYRYGTAVVNGGRLGAVTEPFSDGSAFIWYADKMGESFVRYTRAGCDLRDVRLATPEEVKNHTGHLPTHHLLPVPDVAGTRIKGGFDSTEQLFTNLKVGDLVICSDGNAFAEVVEFGGKDNLFAEVLTLTYGGQLLKQQLHLNTLRPATPAEIERLTKSPFEVGQKVITNQNEVVTIEFVRCTRCNKATGCQCKLPDRIYDVKSDESGCPKTFRRNQIAVLPFKEGQAVVSTAVGTKRGVVGTVAGYYRGYVKVEYPNQDSFSFHLSNIRAATDEEVAASKQQNAGNDPNKLEVGDWVVPTVGPKTNEVGVIVKLGWGGNPVVVFREEVGKKEREYSRIAKQVRPATWREVREAKKPKFDPFRWVGFIGSDVNGSVESSTCQGCNKINECACKGWPKYRVKLADGGRADENQLELRPKT